MSTTWDAVHDADQARSAEEHALLLREADHRGRNALAVTLAVLRLTSAPDVNAYRAAVEQRLHALARAGGLSRLGLHGRSGLDELLDTEVRPFLDLSQTLDACGDAVVLPPRATRMLALVFHELAVNAMKHGALARPGGRILVRWTVGSASDARGKVLRLRWTECGGPVLAMPPARAGFGAELLDAVVARQLGGQVTLSWQAGGLLCDLVVPIATTH
jgi:two-component sensor histidine kinase